MTNEMKLLRAFIEAQSYEIEEVATAKSIAEREEYIALGCTFDPKLEYDYKVTKREKVSRRNNKSEIHRVVREYEAGDYSVGEMLNEIARIESA